MCACIFLHKLYISCEHVCVCVLADVHALLLVDLLVLMQKGPDDRLILRCPSRWLGGGGSGSGDSKTTFSPIVRLDSLLVRPVATGTAGLDRKPEWWRVMAYRGNVLVNEGRKNGMSELRKEGKRWKEGKRDGRE